jgi:hypothetical protein
LNFPKKSQEVFHKELSATKVLELGESLYVSGYIECTKTKWYEILGKFFGHDLRNWSSNRTHIINRSGSPTMFLEELAKNFNAQIQSDLAKK